MNREELSMLGFEIVAYAGDARSALMKFAYDFIKRSQKWKF